MGRNWTRHMTNKELAKQIVSFLGGCDNITTALHCVTRLRFNLKNNELADMKAIEDLEGCLLYTSPSPRDRSVSRMPSSA